MDIVFLYKFHQSFEATELPGRHTHATLPPAEPPPRVRKQLAFATAVIGGMFCIDFALCAAPRAHFNDTAIICLYIACVIAATSRFLYYVDHAAAAPPVNLTIINAVLSTANLLFPHLRPQHFIVQRPEHYFSGAVLLYLWCLTRLTAQRANIWKRSDK